MVTGVSKYSLIIDLGSEILWDFLSVGSDLSDSGRLYRIIFSFRLSFSISSLIIEVTVAEIHELSEAGSETLSLSANKPGLGDASVFIELLDVKPTIVASSSDTLF